MNVIHNVSINQISLLVKIHYSTVGNIIQAYKEEGRTSQPLNNMHQHQSDRLDNDNDLFQ